MYKNVKELAEKENIRLDNEPMTKEQSETFIHLTMMGQEGRLKVCEDIIKDEVPSIFLLAYKRYQAFKMEDKLDLDVLLLVEVFAGGVPGRAVFMLIDILNRFEDDNKKVSWDTVVMQMYPMGFYAPSIIQTIVDGYVKTNKLRNSEIY